MNENICGRALKAKALERWENEGGAFLLDGLGTLVSE